MGTVAYVTNAVPLIKRLWTAAGHDLENHSDGLGNYVCVPNENVPGYVGRDPMELFLRTQIRVPPMRGNVAVLSWQNKNSEFLGFGIGHCTIYLGSLGNEQVLFQQTDCGKPFCVSTLSKEMNLSAESKRTLVVDWYDLRHLRK